MNHRKTSSQRAMRRSWQRGFAFVALAACGKWIGFVALLHARLVFGDDGRGKGVAEFQASGIIGISRGDENSSDRAFLFDVFVSGNRWLIQTVPFQFLTNKAGAAIEAYHAGTDATNIYSAAMLNFGYDQRQGLETALAKLKDHEQARSNGGVANPPASTDNRFFSEVMTRGLAAATNGSQPKLKPRNQAVGDISPGTVPAFDEVNMIAPLWLAFCSHGVLGSSETNLVPGLFHQPSGSASLQFELFETAQVRRSADFPYLPEAIGFSNHTVWLPKTPGRRPSDQPPSASGPIFLEATFEATFERFGGLALPGAFQIRRYSPPTTPTDKPHERYRITGRVTNVTTKVELANFLPHLPAVIAISDKRFVDEVNNRGVRFFTEPGEWPSMATVRRTKEYARMKAEAFSESARSNRRRAISVLAIALISVGFAALAWRSKRNKPKVTQQESKAI